MTPYFHPHAKSAILALAAVDYTAERLPDIPSPTELLLNAIWAYGRHPPYSAHAKFDAEEILSFGWFEAMYLPGMDYVLGEMRLRSEPDTAARWFHDAVYIAALHAFRLFSIAEREALPNDWWSSCPSDIVELDDDLSELVRACGEALGQVEQFARHFAEAERRFENELQKPQTPVWPPLNGMPRSGAEEWFC